MNLLDKFSEFSAPHFEDIGFIAWTEKNFTVYDSGRWIKFSFYNHEPLREIYESWDHPHVTIQKSVQWGVTTCGIARSIYAGHKLGLSSVYFFPTNTHSEIFVSSKYNETINRSDYIKSLLSHTQANNRRLKIFKNFYIHFGGLESATNVRSITADISTIDELDEANQENAKKVEDRLSHSKFGWRWELSQPSLPMQGINLAFFKSDQRYWGCNCPSCNYTNFVDETFPECLIEVNQKVFYSCIKCRSELDLKKGVWIPKFPDRSKFHKGYLLSHLIFPLKQASKLKYEYENLATSIEKKRFWISVLAKPYADITQVPITNEILSKAEGNFNFDYYKHGTFFGMDQGDTCHLVFCYRDNGVLKLCALYKIEATKEEEILSIIGKHNVIAGLVDANPNKVLSKKIAKTFRQIKIQYFLGDSLKEGVEGEGVDAVSKVNVNRTESLDLTCEAIQKAIIQIPSMQLSMNKTVLDLYDECRLHLKNLTKELIETKKGFFVYEYLHKVENHFAMALNSARIAASGSQGIDLDSRFRGGSYY